MQPLTIVQRTEWGALWAPHSVLCTIVKTFIIILINEGAQRAPYSSTGAKNEIADHGKFYKKSPAHTISVHFTKQNECSQIYM